MVSMGFLITNEVTQDTYKLSGEICASYNKFVVA